ncbi:MAG: hypothetical protein KatS3mg105_2138 [Gemmatales bacterium]|nr:MAG: hypothetical protein KatS3mg105_2138 [Gemmatales bacterium]
MNYYVDYSDDFRCNIMPLNDEAAKAFDEDKSVGKNHSGGGRGRIRPAAAEVGQGVVVEGAHKGFMLQQTPDRGVILHKLEGCLGLDGDVAGIILAATLGVVLLLGGEASQVETPRLENDKVQHRLTKRPCLAQVAAGGPKVCTFCQPRLVRQQVEIVSELK